MSTVLGLLYGLTAYTAWPYHLLAFKQKIIFKVRGSAYDPAMLLTGKGHLFCLKYFNRRLSLYPRANCRLQKHSGYSNSLISRSSDCTVTSSNNLLIQMKHFNCLLSLCASYQLTYVNITRTLLFKVCG